MTDLEMTKLCAEAMGLIHEVVSDSAYEDLNEYRWVSIPDGTYKPLEDDAQAMALVQRFHLAIQPPQFVRPPRWHVWVDEGGVGKGKHTGIAGALNLNRAIVECVAKMQQSKPSCTA